MRLDTPPGYAKHSIRYCKMGRQTHMSEVRRLTGGTEATTVDTTRLEAAIRSSKESGRMAAQGRGFERREEDRAQTTEQKFVARLIFDLARTGAGAANVLRGFQRQSMH
ncbi:hypothetical protein MRX96_035079 [Rhipicephalus microplus]